MVWYCIEDSEISIISLVLNSIQKSLAINKLKLLRTQISTHVYKTITSLGFGFGILGFFPQRDDFLEYSPV